MTLNGGIRIFDAALAGCVCAVGAVRLYYYVLDWRHSRDKLRAAVIRVLLGEVIVFGVLLTGHVAAMLDGRPYTWRVAVIAVGYLLILSGSWTVVDKERRVNQTWDEAKRNGNPLAAPRGPGPGGAD